MPGSGAVTSGRETWELCPSHSGRAPGHEEDGLGESPVVPPGSNNRFFFFVNPYLRVFSIAFSETMEGREGEGKGETSM